MLSNLTSSLEAFYAGVAAANVAEAHANSVIQDLARILIPLNYTKGQRFTHGPALPVSGLPALSVASELSPHTPETVGFARTQLMRGAKRTVAALRQATRPLAV